MHQLILLLGATLAVIGGLPLTIAGIGLITGPVSVLYSFKQALARIRTIHNTYEGILSTLFLTQPAYTMYVFDHGRHLSELFVHYLFNTVDHARNKWIASAALARYIASTSPRLLRWLAMPLSWLFTAGIYSASTIQLLTASITGMLLLALHLIFLYVGEGIALSAIATFMAIAALKSMMSSIPIHCPSCYAEVCVPYYRCTGCETLHTQLLPSPYGIFSHRCTTCNTHIPTLDICGRRKLQRLCNHCHYPLPDAIGRGHTMHIALVGDTSAGKTTYITAALQTLTQNWIKQGPCKVAWINPGQQQRHLSHLALIVSDKEMPPTTEHAPQALLLQMHYLKRRKPALLSIYDPAGEVFNSTEQLSTQQYYRFTNGIIFIIDPSALLSDQPGGQASIEHAATPTNKHAIMQIYERLLSTIEAFSGVSASQRYTQPIAVVVTKADTFRLEDELGSPALHALMQRKPSITEAEASHQIVRRFLYTHGLDNLIRDIEAHFTSVHYFSCSVQVNRSSSDTTSKVITNRVLAPLTWLLANNGMEIEDAER